MELSEEFETGWPGWHQARWCIRRTGAQETLCGRKVDRTRAPGWFAVPPVGPSDPASAHPECLAVWQRLLEASC